MKKKNNKINFRSIVNCLLVVFIMLLPFGIRSVYADVNVSGPSSSDISTFNSILEPVMKVYNFVKYAASFLALLFLVFAAIQMFMNNNPMEKEVAKTRMMYIVIGMIVIWVAPIAVNYLTQT